MVPLGKRIEINGRLRDHREGFGQPGRVGKIHRLASNRLGAPSKLAQNLLLEQSLKTEGLFRDICCHLVWLEEGAHCSVIAFSSSTYVATVQTNIDIVITAELRTNAT